MKSSPTYPTKAQAEVIKRHGLLPCIYMVLMDLPTGLVVLRIIDGLVKHLEK